MTVLLIYTMAIEAVCDVFIYSSSVVVSSPMTQSRGAALWGGIIKITYSAIFKIVIIFMLYAVFFFPWSVVGWGPITPPGPLWAGDQSFPPGPLWGGDQSLPPGPRWDQGEMIGPQTNNFPLVRGGVGINHLICYVFSTNRLHLSRSSDIGL